MTLNLPIAIKLSIHQLCILFNWFNGFNNGFNINKARERKAKIRYDYMKVYKVFIPRYLLRDLDRIK